MAFYSLRNDVVVFFEMSVSHMYPCYFNTPAFCSV